jgi:hypothetical protein
MTNHINWQIPTISIIPSHAKTIASIFTWSTHISTDGRPTVSTLTEAKLNIIKMKDLYDSQDCMAKQIYPCMNPNPKA